MEGMVQELQALAAEAPDFSPRQLKNAENRGLVRSAFQKAVRRGELDRALRSAEYLYDADESYAWHALATIAIEDISFGDLDLVAYSTMTTLKSIRTQMHSDLLFAAMVKRACEAPKSQSACELSLGTDISAPELWEEMQGLPDADLHMHMVSGVLEPAYRAAVIMRKRLRGLGLEALIPTLQVIMNALDDPTEKRAAMLSFERTVDTMNVGLFPVLHWLNGLGELVEEIDERPEWPPEDVIMSVSSAAFDMHTPAGKKAIKAFWTSMKGDYPWVAAIPPENAVKALGSLVFIVEGGLVDRRLMHARLWELKWYRDLNFAIGYGVPDCTEDTLKDLLATVRQEIPRLNEKRKWATSL